MEKVIELLEELKQLVFDNPELFHDGINEDIMITIEHVIKLIKEK